jgi:hypothetical protein
VEVVISTGRGKRRGLIVLTALLGVIVGGIAAPRVVGWMLKAEVVRVLGPSSQIERAHLGWSELDVEGLRIRASEGWPASDALRAEHVRVATVPVLRDLLSGRVRIRSVTVVRPYVSALRTSDGTLQVVPGLVGTPSSNGRTGAPAPSLIAPPVTIARIVVQDAVVEVFDASVASPPLRIRLEQIQATVQDVRIPSMTGKSQFDLAGVLKGVRQDGQIALAGWTEIATRDSSVTTTLRSVDLVALQPYLIKAADSGVQKGLLDLDLQSEVRNNRLRAPGKATISDLELVRGRGVYGPFLGVPRDTVLAFLRAKDNKVIMNFVLEGDINDPRFSLNAALSMRLASSMAETMGVSLSGVIKGAGTLGERGLGALGGLFGNAKDLPSAPAHRAE